MVTAELSHLLQELSYPISSGDLIGAIGRTEVEYPTGKVETIEQICLRIAVDGYASAGDAELAIRAGLDGDAVGRRGYSDRDPPIRGIDEYDPVSF